MNAENERNNHRMVNTYLNKARQQKNDEFYTQLEDIEEEMRHYKDHFRDKVVYCNCDDPTVSNFFFYFSRNFKKLGLKKLITTCYKNQDRDLFSSNDQEQAIYLEYSGTRNADGIPDDDEIVQYPLQGDGDFRSEECVQLLKEADIVVTNPPFSLFREYIAQLIKYDKKFLVLGNHNAVTYKEIFPLIKDKKMWLGVNNGGTKWFEVSPEYEILTESRQKYENGKKYFSMGNVNWFTNLDNHKRHEDLILYQKYLPQKYPTYDNYDAIEVSRYADIPADYEGEMGVPITFLSKYNPAQFNIVDIGNSLKIKNKNVYARVVIKRKQHR